MVVKTVFKQFGEWGIKLKNSIRIEIVLALITIGLLSLGIFVAVEQFVGSMIGNMSILYIDVDGGIAAIIAIIFFIILVYIFLTRYIKYITNIMQGVTKIKHNIFNEKIDVRQNNELTKLADEINEMSTFIYNKIEEERDNERKQRELVSNLSHDIKSPLTSILGYVDLLRNQYGSEEYFKILDKKSKELHVLVDDLLLYSTLTNSEVNYDFNKIDLGKLVMQHLYENEQMYTNANLNLVIDCEVDTYVSADIKYIIRVIDNLVSNTIKYSKEGTDVEVRVKEVNDYINFTISNVSEYNLEEDYHKLLERTYVHSKSRTKQSSGIGLSIVEQIVTKHMGKIDLTYNNDILSVEIAFLKY